MRIHKRVISIVLISFAIILFSPHLPSCHTCYIEYDDNDTSMTYVSDFQIADISLMIESTPSCANHCGNVDGDNTHCHELHCHTGTCCDLTYIVNNHKFNINQYISKENLNHKEQLAFDDLISSIFKPPQINASRF